MAYSTGEAALLTLVQTNANFDSNNSSRANWRILNSGKSDHYVVLRPGPFELEWISATKYIGHWRTVVEVWQRYTDETTTNTNLYTYVASLIATILPERLFNNTAGMSDSGVSGGDEPTEQWTNNADGPSWLRWSLNVDWTEEVTVTFTD